ncbi:MAG: hypothetical protein H7A23_08660 [Leptospiraceae bacterium]|nr:hypothetical protein [Leptospiraceae bacterium]MCP5494616.1 hypothetical protein [Leptospiraceae bacterium]
MSELDEKNQAYLNCLNSILKLTQSETVSSILKQISEIPEDLEDKDAILTEMERTRVFPDSLMTIITMMIFLVDERDQINQLYEDAMERYDTINRLTTKSKPTEDEAKIKKTLTDFILKIESFYETHDKADEGTLREMNKFMVENKLKEGSEKSFLEIKLANRSISQIQPHLVTLLDTYFQYKKNKGIMKRLIKISNYIIEDAQKKAS